VSRVSRETFPAALDIVSRETAQKIRRSARKRLKTTARAGIIAANTI